MYSSFPYGAGALAPVCFATTLLMLTAAGIAQAAPSTTLEQTRPTTPPNSLENSRPLPPGPPRWAEDYRFLDDASKRTDVFDPFRYQRLSESAWVQFGAEMRYRADTFNNPVFGLRGVNKDSYIQQRLQVHGDLHLFDDRVRAFVQLENTQMWNKALYGPYDESRTELHQAFIDVNSEMLGGKLMTRVGRQELAYGNQAFVTYRDARNIRLNFDGVRLSYSGASGYKLDAFALRPVTTSEDSFDDGSNNNVKFYGLYGTLPKTSALMLDVYGFDLETDERTLAGLSGSEKRYTGGVRLFGKQAGWDWTWDFAYQGGHLEDASIQAWGISSETGYTFSHPWKPRLAVRFDAASGDDRFGDDKVGTFDPLFPKNGFYGDSGLTTLSNIYLIGPLVTFAPRSYLQLESGVFAVWRESTNDGVYMPGMSFVPGTPNSSSSKTGNLFRNNLRWMPTSNLTVDLEYSYFQAGKAIRQADGSDTHFGMVSTTFRF
ncbi:alginate export protein [Pseudomonas duriflava]|uniref:Alginate export protein n=1 Tax=Pseudomonas duriflava TaxID=459528 RepID=A0A562QEB9_9PSED|nr:alginate export family protein [Pseudomonas duriflava]TWI55049.1 alginate export protein [Pseudomonas duriflava]